MRSKRIDNEAGRQTFVLVFETGDEAIAELNRFAREQRLSAAQFTGIGAFSRATLGYFDWERKEYEPIEIDEQVEVVALIGDVALHDGEPAVHAHVVVARSTGAASGGHLLEGRVRPTLEVVLSESPAHLRKRLDPDSGLALITIDEEVPPAPQGEDNLARVPMGLWNIDDQTLSVIEEEATPQSSAEGSADLER